MNKRMSREEQYRALEQKAALDMILHNEEMEGQLTAKIDWILKHSVDEIDYVVNEIKFPMPVVYVLLNHKEDILLDKHMSGWFMLDCIKYFQERGVEKEVVIEFLNREYGWKKDYIVYKVEQYWKTDFPQEVRNGNFDTIRYALQKDMLLRGVGLGYHQNAVAEIVDLPYAQAIKIIEENKENPYQIGNLERMEQRFKEDNPDRQLIAEIKLWQFKLTPEEIADKLGVSAETAREILDRSYAEISGFDHQKVWENGYFEEKFRILSREIQKRVFEKEDVSKIISEMFNFSKSDTKRIMGFVM